MYANAEQDENRPSRWFHLELHADATADAVRDALHAAGLPGRATAATFEKDGMILTARMAAFTWDSHSGAGDYEEDGDNDAPLLADLSKDDQNTFIDAVLRRASEFRGETDMHELTSRLKARHAAENAAATGMTPEEQRRLARQDANTESHDGLISAARIYDGLRNQAAG